VAFRLKIAVAVLALAFTAIWLTKYEVFPISHFPMYSHAALVEYQDFYEVRDVHGNRLNPDATTFVAIFMPTYGYNVLRSCFSIDRSQCHKVLRGLARRFDVPLTVQSRGLNFETGRVVVNNTYVFDP
jgi:hypothetical protein